MGALVRTAILDLSSPKEIVRSGGLNLMDIKNL